MNPIILKINDIEYQVEANTSVATALMMHHFASRRSVQNELRAPFCGMGVCHECRVLIDGIRKLACQTMCKQGMQVVVEQ